MAKYLKDFRRGDSVTKKVTITTAYGNPVNLTNYVFTLSLKSDLDEATPALSVTHAAGAGSHDDLDGGFVYIPVPASLTAALEPGKYFYDIEMRCPNPDGGEDLVSTIAPPISDYKDRVIVAPDITT